MSGSSATAVPQSWNTVHIVGGAHCLTDLWRVMAIPMAYHATACAMGFRGICRFTAVGSGGSVM